jgi:hypothetical protein
LPGCAEKGELSHWLKGFAMDEAMMNQGSQSTLTPEADRGGMHPLD